MRSIQLLDFPDPFFNTWQPVKISEDTYVTRFNTEFGNGWFTIKGDELLEIFYNKGERGYKNLITNEVWSLEEANLIISSINATEDNSYSIVCYPMLDSPNNKILILQRRIQLNLIRKFSAE